MTLPSDITIMQFLIVLVATFGAGFGWTIGSRLAGKFMTAIGI